MKSNRDIFYLSEFRQNTHKPNWYLDGLKSKSVFFYLIYWKDMGLIKVGYKKSLESFKKDYGKYNHIKPDYSHIWLINGANNLDSAIDIHRASAWLKNFVIEYESKIHRKLKEKIIKLPKYREVYVTNSTKQAIEIIKESLSSFGIETYREFLNRNDIRIEEKFSRFIK